MRASILSALALALALSVCLAPGAMAASSSGATVYLYDTGNAAPDATCDWYAKVTSPMYVYTGENLTVDVTMVMYNGTGLAADGVYTVAMTISDGTTAVTADVEITTATALTGTITFAAADLATLSNTTAGTMLFSLLDSTDAGLDSYLVEDVVINADQAMATVDALGAMMISAFAVVMVIGAIGALFAKLGGIFRKR